MEKDNTMTKGMRTKKKIYETARELFEQYKIEQISVDDIVKKAGISKGTFYVHFQSKWSLIVEYIKTLDIEYGENYNSIPAGTPSVEAIRLVTQNMAGVLSRYVGRKVLGQGYAAILLGKLDSSVILNLGRSLPQIFDEIFTLGIQKGEFRSTCDAQKLSNLVMSIIRGTAFEWCADDGMDLEQEVLRRVELFTGTL